MAREFEWDPVKAKRNLRVHGVSFEEATSVYGDAKRLELVDAEHSEGEDRDIVIGYSSDMKQSGSSARGKRMRTRNAAMLKGVNVRFVKFTPEEMAYEAPADVSDPKRFPSRSVWEAFCKRRKDIAVLDPKVRALYPSDAELNKALLKLAEAASHVGVGR